jgi:hypothetical protein
VCPVEVRVPLPASLGTTRSPRCPASPLGVRGAICLHSQRRFTMVHVVPKQDQQRQLVQRAAAWCLRSIGSLDAMYQGLLLQTLSTTPAAYHLPTL